jgi:hypothetical protein
MLWRVRPRIPQMGDSWIDSRWGRVVRRTSVASGPWKVVHRHADPVTTPQPAESVIQQYLTHSELRRIPLLSTRVNRSGAPENKPIRLQRINHGRRQRRTNPARIRHAYTYEDPFYRAALSSNRSLRRLDRPSQSAAPATFRNGPLAWAGGTLAAPLHGSSSS